MKKAKKIFISVFALAMATFVAVCVIAIVSHYNKLAEISINDTLEFGDGEEARIIILAGQSNAEGISFGEYLKNGVTPEQYEKYQNGFENVYINNYNAPSMVTIEYIPKLTSVEDIQSEYNIGKDESVEDIIAKLTDEMLKCASAMEFEKAAELRDKIKELENLL